VVEVEVGAGVVVRDGKGELNPPRRSVAVAPAWTREPNIILSKQESIRYLAPHSRRCNVLGNRGREFITARNALNHDIVRLDSDGLEFGGGTLEEGVDYGFVPSGVNDCDAEGRAVER